MKIDVSGAASLTAPGTTTFTDTLSNIGPATADDVAVRHYLPWGVTRESVESKINPGVGSVTDWGTSGGTNYFVWTVGNRFASGSNAVLTVECPLATGASTNLVQVTTSTGDYDESNNTDKCVTVVGALPKLYVTAITTNKVYGETLTLANTAYILQLDGTNDYPVSVSDITVDFTNAQGQVVDARTATAPAGTYAIRLGGISGTGIEQFTGGIFYTNGVLTVEKAPAITVTAISTNKVYGEELALEAMRFVASIAGTNVAETVTGIDVAFTNAAGAAANPKASYAPAGLYGIDLSNIRGFDTNNYEGVDYVPGVFEVKKATLAVAAPNIVKVYDGVGTNVTAVIDGGDPAGHTATYLYSATQDGPYVEWQNLQFTNVVFDGSSVTSNHVWYAVTTEPPNYLAVTNDAWVTITQRCAMVVAADVVKKPGEMDPASFAWDVRDAATALVAGEKTSVYEELTNIVELVRTPAGEAPGDYTITTNAPFAAQTTGVLANYALVFTPGTLKITDQIPLTFYVASTSVVYGAEVPTTGFRFDHTDPATYEADKIPALDTVTFATTYTNKAPVSGVTYAITTNNDALASLYYKISVVPGTLTVTQRCVTITGASATKVYDGAALSNITVTVTGFVEGEGIVTNDFASITDVGKKENAFTYAAKEGTDFGNYALPSKPTFGELEVTPAPILPVKPGEEPPTDPTKAWTRVENVIKCYDGLGTNIWPTCGNLIEGNAPTYRYGTSETGPFDRAWEDLQFTNVVFDAYGNVTSNPVWYVVTTKKGEAVNYFAATNSAYVMITQRCVTVTADNTNKVYGTTIAFKGTEFTTDPATLPNGETITRVTLSCDQAASPEAPVDDYPIVPSNPQGENGFNESNYKIDLEPGALTVTKASLAVSAPNIVKVYDGAGTNVTAAIDGGEPAGHTATYLYSTTQDGPYVEWQNLQYTNVIFDGASVTSNRVWYKASTTPENYFAATNYAYVTITPRPLTVKADDVVRKPGLGDTKPFAWSVDPSEAIIAGEETAVYLSLTNDVGVSEKLDRTPAGEAPGDYAITTNAPFAAQTTGVLANYALAFTPGTLTITDKDPLTFYVANTNVVYGADVPTGFGFDHTDPATYDPKKITGLDKVQFKTTYYKKAPVSGATYTITTNSALSSDAYTIAVVPGTLTVTPATLTIVASDTNKVYGTAIAFAGTEFEPPVGLVDDERVTNVTLVCDAAATPGASVGTYEIVPGLPLLGDRGFDFANYTLDPTNGTLTVTKATIATPAPGEEPPTEPDRAWTQAANITKCYDGLGTNITPTANLPFGDTASYLFSTNPAGPFVADLQFTNVTFDAKGNVSSNTVYYTITTDKSGAENYFAATNFAYVAITQRCVTVRANDASKAYGTSLALSPTAFEITAGTMAGGEELVEVTVTSTNNAAGDPLASVGIHAGEILPSHPVKGRGANFTTNNYDFAFLAGDLEVKKIETPVIVTAIVTNKPYGAELVLDATRFIASIEGTNGTETVTGVDVVFSNEVGGVWVEAYPTNAAAAIGEYRIYLSNIAGPGYAAYSGITYVPGKLTVGKTPLTIVASDTNKVYGTAIAFAGTEFEPPVGLVDDERVTNVTLVCDAAATPGASVGTYEIVPGLPLLGDHGFNSANYTLDPTNGTLTVTKATIATPAPGEEPPTEPDRAWTQAANITKCYDGLGTNITPTANLPFGDTASYLFSTNPAGPFVADLQFTNVTFDAKGNVSSNAVYYTITTDKSGAENYFAATNFAYVAITQRCVTVRANDASKAYGTSLALSPTAFEITAGTMAGGEELVEVTVTSTNNAAGDPLASVGIHAGEILPSHPLKGRGANFTTNNYDFAFLAGDLEVKKIETPVIVTAVATNKPYGAELALDATNYIFRIEGTNGTETVTGVDVVFSNKLGGVWRQAWPTNAIAPAGDYVICLSNLRGSGFDVYGSVRYVPGKLSVGKTPLTIVASDTNKVYGTAIAFAGTEFEPPVGLVGDERVTNVTLACAAAAAPGASVGTYEIVPGLPILGDRGFDIANYALDTTNGTLTVTPDAIATPAPGTVPAEPTRPWTQAANIVKCYDGHGTNICPATENLIAGNAVNYLFKTDGMASFVAWEDLQFTNVTFDAAGNVTSNKVTYTASTWDGVAENYFAATNFAYVTITQRCVTVTAAGTNKVYGTTVDLSPTAFEITAGTMAGGEELVEVTVTSTNNAAGDPLASVGVHAGEILPSHPVKGRGANFTTNNYDFAFLAGDLEVKKPATPITITVGSASRPYDGTPLVSTWDYEPKDALMGDDRLVVTLDVESITDAGKTNVTVRSYEVMRGTTKVTAFYLFAEPVPGTLAVTPRAITLTSHSADKLYDGSELVNREEPSVSGDGFAGGEGVTCTVTGRQVDAGESDNAFDYVFAAGAKAVNYVVEKKYGKLVVGRRKVILTSGSAAKRYDGKPLVNHEVTVSGDGWAAGEGADCDVTGSQTDVGESANVFSFELHANTRAQNYEISKVPGTLKVLAPPTPIVITAASASKMYDGTPLVTNGYTYTEGVIVEGDELEAVVEGTITDAGSVSNRVTSYRVLREEVDVTGNYTFEPCVDGILTVTQRCVTLTSGSAAKQYDGKPLVNREVTVSGDGWAAGEGADYDVTGTRTAVGEADNTFEYLLRSNTKAGNYIITKVLGRLVVTVPPAPQPAVLSVSFTSSLNWNTGLFDIELTVANVGKGGTDPACAYSVRLKPGPAASGAKTSVARSYYLDSPTGRTSDGYDYIDLTASILSALRSVGNGDAVFDPGERVTVRGIGVYHWKRCDPSTFIDADSFFVASRLVNTTDAFGPEMYVEPEHAATVPVTATATLASVSATPSPARTFDGVLSRGAELAGTVQVRIAASNRKTGLARLTATVAPVGERKISLTGNIAADGTTFTALTKDGRSLELSFGADDLSGSFDGCPIEGARNRYSSKSADDRAVVAAADAWIGSYAIACPAEDGWDALTVRIAKKGKVTVSGTLADGTALSASAQMIIGAEGCQIPIVLSKRDVSRAFSIWLADPDASEMEIVGLEDAVISKVCNLAGEGVFRVNGQPLGTVAPSGKRWVAASDVNLRLTFTERTGVFRGSYKVTSTGDGIRRTTLVTVRGIVVGGVGYGTATAKGQEPLAVTIE